MLRRVSLIALIILLSISANAFAGLTTQTGTLPDGATYLIQVPSSWNGTLLLYSHGYVVPGSPNPARDVGDPATGAFLLAAGFALAGSSIVNHERTAAQSLREWADEHLDKLPPLTIQLVSLRARDLDREAEAYADLEARRAGRRRSRSSDRMHDVTFGPTGASGDPLHLGLR
jgi:hypothetical protein